MDAGREIPTIFVNCISRGPDSGSCSNTASRLLRLPPPPTQLGRFQADPTAASARGTHSDHDTFGSRRRGGRARGRRESDSGPLAGGEDGGQVRGPEQPRLPRPSLAGRPPVAGEDPGRSFPRRARRRATRPPPSTRSTALSPTRGARRGSRPGVARPARGRRGAAGPPAGLPPKDASRAGHAPEPRVMGPLNRNKLDRSAEGGQGGGHPTPASVQRP